MIVKTKRGDREVRATGQEWGNSWLIPQPGTEYLAGSGTLVSGDTAFGLPAVGNVVRSASEIVASLPFEVYRGRPRVPATDTWQWQLLNEEPDDIGTSSYCFFYDIALSLESTQNAFIQKAKSPRRVEALTVLNPQRVKVYINKDTGDKNFDIYVDPTTVKKGLTVDDIIHIRGFTPHPGSIAGASLVQMHRDPLGNALALQGFEGDYFKNSAQPPFWFTGAKNQAHAQELLSFHNAEHRGSGQRWRTGATWGEVDVKSIPVAMADAQWADAKRVSIEDACRIWRWPKELAEMSTGREVYPTEENAWLTRIMKLYVLPRLKRIERAFAADKDVFLMSGLSGLFDTEEFQRADFVNRVRGYKDARQGGWVTANEIRAKENLPPVVGGDELLLTPTGSAPNPSTNGQVEGEVVLK